MPSFTIVLYLGSEPWNPPLTSTEVLDDVPEFMHNYMPFYHLIFVDMRNIPEDKRKKFFTILRFIVNCLCLLKTPSALKEYLHNHTPKRIPPAAIRFLKAYANLDFKINKEKNMYNPMKAVEKLWVKDGIAIGLKRGEKKGEKKGERRGEKRGMVLGRQNLMLATIKNALDMGYSGQDIMRLFNLSSRKYSQIIAEHF